MTNDFDLSKCKKNALGQPICKTRSGMSVRILCTNAKSSLGTIVALVYYPSADIEGLEQFQSNGRYGLNHVSDGSMDLVNVPEEREGWLNVYKDTLHTSRDEADSRADQLRIACLHIKFKYGEGL